jgi:hypothetical protein
MPMELPSLEPAALSPALLDGLHSLQYLKHLEGAAADLHQLPAAARSLQSAADSLERFHTRLMVIGLGFWVVQGCVRWAWSRAAAPSSAPATADEIQIAGAIRCVVLLAESCCAIAGHSAMPTAETIIEHFGLVKHPEGGYFRETYRSGSDLTSSASR